MLNQFTYRKKISQTSIGTWNIRGLRNQFKEVEEVLIRKEVDVCSFQETKTDEIEEETSNYNIVCFPRKQIQYGQAFFVKKTIKVEELKAISDRISYIVVRKSSKFKSKETPTGTKVFRINKKRTKIVIVNVYAPHMGRTAKNVEETEEFYKELRTVLAKFKGCDAIVTGNFNAKLGKKKTRTIRI